MTLRRYLYKTLITISLILFSPVIQGQDKIELGVFLGGCYYLGDLNPSQQFKDFRPAIGGIARYALSDRWALKGNVIAANMAGKYPGSGDVYLHNEGYERHSVSADGTVHTTIDSDYSFNRTVIDAGLTAEVNFRSYDHMFRQEQTRFTPYLTFGLATTIYERYETKSDRKTVFVLSLPFGLGVKYKVNKWLRIGCEWSWRKTFTDELDTVEPDEAKVNPADPYGMGKSKWTHNNDWYSLIGVTLTCSMWPRKISCNDGVNKNFNRR